MTSNILNFLKGVFRTSTKGYNVEERDGLVYRTGSPNPFSGNVHYKQDYGKRKGSSFIGYKDGLRHGMTEKYFFYERYTFEHQFPSDRPLRKQIQEICEYKDGKKHGIRKLYEELGGIIRKENYKEGKLHGPVHVYNDSNLPEVYGNYDKGKLVPYESYYDNGYIETKKNWKESPDSDSLIKVGVWELYNKNYKDTLLNKIVYEDGRMKEKTTYGSGYMFSIPGTIESVTKYEDNKTVFYEEYWSSPSKEKGEVKIKGTFGDEGWEKDEFFWSNGRMILKQEKNDNTEEGRYFRTCFLPSGEIDYSGVVKDRFLYRDFFSRNNIRDHFPDWNREYEKN